MAGMRNAYFDQLDAIVDELASMTQQVQQSVARATHALLTADGDVAGQVIADDAKIDATRERIEDQVFELLALQQPVAGDLRMLFAATRMVGDLERMGDLSVHVAKVAQLRVPEVAVPAEMVPTVEQMAHVAVQMVGAAAAVIAERDIDAARALEQADEEMDELRRARSGSCSARAGRTASSRRSTSRCSAATTSGSPTTRSRWPAGSSTWSPARSRTSINPVDRPPAVAATAAEQLLERRDLVGVRSAPAWRARPARSQQRDQLAGRPVDALAEPAVGGGAEVLGRGEHRGRDDDRPQVGEQRPQRVLERERVPGGAGGRARSASACRPARPCRARRRTS